MKRVAGILLMITVASFMLMIAACDNKGGAKGGDPLVGTWGMVDNPSKSVKIYKEGENYIYEGSQGKTPAVQKDPNTLVVPMGGLEVNVVHDPASGVLTVSFLGEVYKYKKQ